MSEFVVWLPEQLPALLSVLERSEDYESWFWRVKPDGVRFLVQCSDLFYWGTADLEPIEPDDLPLLRQTLADLEVHDCAYYLAELFSCRRRGMRPQTPFFRKYVKDEDGKSGHYDDSLSPEVRALFDAAGPVRDRKDEG